jgi:hypothetical protein
MRHFVEKTLDEAVLVKSFPEDVVQEDPVLSEHSIVKEALSPVYDNVKISALVSVPNCITFCNNSNFLSLKERMVAAESCVFVSQVSYGRC